MSEHEPVDCWIGRAACGCIDAACVDRNGCEQQLGEWLRLGLKVERAIGPVTLPWRCADCKVKLVALGWPEGEIH